MATIPQQVQKPDGYAHIVCSRREWLPDDYQIIQADTLEHLQAKVSEVMALPHGLVPLGAPQATDWWPHACVWPEKLPLYQHDIGYSPVGWMQAMYVPNARSNE